MATKSNKARSRARVPHTINFGPWRHDPAYEARMCERFDLMHPSQAQHTPVIRVPGFLSGKEIAAICEVVDSLRAQDAGNP